MQKKKKKAPSKPRNRSRATPKANLNVSRNYWLQTRTIILGAAAVAGWLCSLWLGILDLPQKINSYYAEKEQALANLSAAYDPSRYLGRWTNDPDLDLARNVISDRPESEKEDRGSLQISIVREYDGSFVGEIVSSKVLDAHLPWTSLMLRGRIGSFGGFKGEVLEIRNNRFVSLGSFELVPSKTNESHLEFVSFESASRFLPERATLWRTEALQFGGERNPRFDDLLREHGRTSSD